MVIGIKIKRQSDGNYQASCPSLPGCMVCGQTKADVRLQLGVAVQGYLANLEVNLPRELAAASGLKKW